MTVVLGKIKHYLRCKNKTNKNKINIMIYENTYQRRKLKDDKSYFRYVKLTNQMSFKTNVQKVDTHTGGKWLIRDAKHRKGS